MATVLGEIRETFSAIDRLGPVNYVMPTLRSTFHIEDRQSTLVQITHRDAFVASDSISGSAYVHVLEAFSAQSAVYPHATITQLVREQFKVADRAQTSVGLQGLLADQFLASGRLAHAGIAVQLRDGAIVTGRATSALHSMRQIKEVFAAQGWAVPRQIGHIRDTFSAGDSYQIGSDLQQILRETFVASETAHPHKNGFGHVLERFSVQDTAHPRSILVDQVRERMYITELVHPLDRFVLGDTIDQQVPLSATDAWTADMNTWGMSRYVGLPISQFTGTQFAVGEQGIFTYDPDNHPMAFVETGDMTLVVDAEPVFELKRLNYVYSYARQSQPLKLYVTADHNGSRVSTIYTQESRSSTDTRAVRTPVGRGYKSNYIKLRIGAARQFDLSGLEVETTVTGRRI